MEITRTELIEAVINTLQDYNVKCSHKAIAKGIADSLMMPEDPEDDPVDRNCDYDLYDIDDFDVDDDE